VEKRHTLTFWIKTEPEFDQGHGVFFNRGTIASHAFETTFNNKPLTDEGVLAPNKPARAARRRW
jgi:hypothetical protein